MNRNKKNIIVISICLFMFLLIALISSFKDKKSFGIETKKIDVKVMSYLDDSVLVQDSNNIIYTFNDTDMIAPIGQNITIKYTGVLDKNKSLQNSTIVDYEVITVTNDNTIPKYYLDDGIFSDYYILAYNDLKKLSLDEKISQLLLVRYPNNNQKEILAKYKFGGYLFFEKDFKDKTKEEVINMINDLQKISKIPILTAVDEEGGKVVRVSSNKNLSSEKFKSPKILYETGGLDLIKTDTIEKSKLLKELGLNLNLAPVIDVSTNESDYMYDRTIGKNTEITSSFARIVIESSKNTGVSYTLKHFPGYGNNSDTHVGSSTDNRSYSDISNNDIPPFQSGINAGAEAVLVSHNIINSIDAYNPASLSPSIHNLLRNDLNFTGIIISDDLDMGAINNIDNSTIKAILGGNDLIITTDYEKSINEIKSAIQNNVISEQIIDKLTFRILAWKYYKGLMFETLK